MSLEPRYPDGQDQDDLTEARVPPVLNLPLFVVLLILDLLDRKDIHTFGLVSRGCSRIVEPILFRKVIIHKRNSPESNSHICNRLADPQDPLSENVHHLQVRFNAIEDLPDVKLLEGVVENLQNLEDFSWHSRFPIPSSLLEKFHAKHPFARLHLKNAERNLPREPYQPADYRALSSPQLHSLDYTAYQIDRESENGEYKSIGDISAIKDALLQARNLKRLRFQISRSYSPVQADWSLNEGFFQFGDGEVFPTLEELELSYEHDQPAYDLNFEACQGWVKAMDWSKLRRLHLGYSCDARYLFTALAGKVPNLKAVKFHHSNREAWLHFFECIDKLEEIEVLDPGLMGSPGFIDTLSSTRGQSLRKLHIDDDFEGNGYTAEEVGRIVQNAPGIRSLKLVVHGERGKYLEWPKATMEHLSSLQYLRELDVAIHIQRQLLDMSDNGSEGAMRSFYLMRIAKGMATSFYEQLHGGRKNSSIHYLKVTFRTPRPRTEWPFIIHRESRDGEKFRVVKGFASEVSVPESAPEDYTGIPAGAYPLAFD